MKKLILTFSKAKFELRKVIIGIFYIGLLFSPFKALTGNFKVETFVLWLSLTILLTIQQLALYDTNTK
ncbi:hypothetical protein [Clostridium culturomicium]|uniref:hypothetical protein n=1 Tax=Clostridium culturomicium TaxID=1499683 RepID=UPI0038574A8F